MAKFLKIGANGVPAQESTVATSAGAGDSGKIAGLDGSGKLDASFMPTGFGSDTKTMTAGEAISAGNIVYVSGTGTVLKADANTLAKAAVGFVLAGIANAASGTVYLGSGIISGLSGLTAGGRYFLSNSATGSFDLYANLTFAAGDIIQEVGYALSATELYFEPQTPAEF